MSMEQAVETAISALGNTPARDGAALELARTYARQLDRAGIIRAAADKALKAAESSKALDRDTLVEQVTALRAKCSERDAVEKLGAKLQSILVELLMTPKARAAVVKGADTDDQPVSPLDELRQRRTRGDIA